MALPEPNHMYIPGYVLPGNIVFRLNKVEHKMIFGEKPSRTYYGKLAKRKKRYKKRKERYLAKRQEYIKRFIEANSQKLLNAQVLFMRQQEIELMGKPFLSFQEYPTFKSVSGIMNRMSLMQTELKPIRISPFLCMV